MAVAALATGAPAALRAQAPCPRAWLPAYAHNDYENARPLADALALGYRGAEADVFLVDGTLRVGHDRTRARRGPTFEALYLAPLRAVVARCGRLTADATPFLLTVELKERSRAAHDSLMAVVARYATMLVAAPRTSGQPERAPVEVVLVGWHPGAQALAADRSRLVGRQERITTRRRWSPPDTAGPVRLLSLDYGKTMGRWWVSAAERQRWLAVLAEAGPRAPECRLRVYNLPPDPELYRRLRAAGVDLIGTKHLARSAAALAAPR